MTNPSEVLEGHHAVIRLFTQGVDLDAVAQDFVPAPVVPGAYVQLLIWDDGAETAPEMIAHIVETFVATK